jgi:hypothetical protein
MSQGDEDTPRRSWLTPIGDELQRSGLPLEPGKASVFAVVRRLTRRPRNRVGSVVYGLGVFVLVVGALAALAYGIGLVVEHNSNLGHGLSLLVVFLVLGCVASLIGVRSRNILFGLAVAASILALGFGFWGRGSPRAEVDVYLDGLARLVGPDWGRPSAACKRALGPSSGLSLCTVQGVAASDRFQVCVTWVRTLIYRPVRKCGVDAPGLTYPPLHSLAYRASAVAACLRDLPPVPDGGLVLIDILAVTPIHRYGQSGTEVDVRFGTGVANLYFLGNEAGAERWLQYLRRTLPIQKQQQGKGLYRRRNVVVVWGDSAHDFASELDACLAA